MDFLLIFFGIFLFILSALIIYLLVCYLNEVPKYLNEINRSLHRLSVYFAGDDDDE